MLIDVNLAFKKGDLFMPCQFLNKCFLGQNVRICINFNAFVFVKFRSHFKPELCSEGVTNIMKILKDCSFNVKN